MILDVVYCYPLLFLLSINIEIGKIVVKCLTGNHLYGKLLFTWLSLMTSLMVFFFAVWDFTESVSEGFLTSF